MVRVRLEVDVDTKVIILFDVTGDRKLLASEQRRQEDNESAEDDQDDGRLYNLQRRWKKLQNMT